MGHQKETPVSRQPPAPSPTRSLSSPHLILLLFSPRQEEEMNVLASSVEGVDVGLLRCARTHCHALPLDDRTLRERTCGEVLCHEDS